MSTEPCRVCEATVPYSDTVHVMVHTKSGAGVVDGYLCHDCYEEHLQAWLE